jgi:hypothetical protein
MKRVFSLCLLMSWLLAACVHAPPKDLSRFNEAKPSSILVVPVVNESAEVTAPDFFLSTVSMPLAERGYYVFPVNLVKRVLEDEGLSDATLVSSAPAGKICKLFGADSVLYVKIKEWNAQYKVLSTSVNVRLNYVIKDCKSGDTLWRHEQAMLYTPQNINTGNLIGDLVVMAVSAAMTKASPNYVPLARQANALAFYHVGAGIPLGPYATPVE